MRSVSKIAVVVASAVALSQENSVGVANVNARLLRAACTKKPVADVMEEVDGEMQKSGLHLKDDMSDTSAALLNGLFQDWVEDAKKGCYNRLKSANKGLGEKRKAWIEDAEKGLADLGKAHEPELYELSEETSEEGDDYGQFQDIAVYDMEELQYMHDETKGDVGNAGTNTSPGGEQISSEETSQEEDSVESLEKEDLSDTSAARLRQILDGLAKEDEEKLPVPHQGPQTSFLRGGIQDGHTAFEKPRPDSPHDVKYYHNQGHERHEV